MPQNTPMKMQWITVDGRQTPIVLPQIWNHDKQDWEVTSDQNRLPVDARLTGSNVEQAIIQGAGEGSLSAGGRESIIIQPPSGYIYEIISMEVLIQSPSGSASGSHRVLFRPANHISGAPTFLSAIYSHGENIEFRGEFNGNPTSVSPTEKTNQLLSVKGVVINFHGLELRYLNDTDVQNSEIRRYTILAKKIKVVQ